MSNLTTTKYRRGTSTRVDFPTLPSLTAQPRKIDLIQKQYKHDLLLLEFSSESTTWFESLKTGVPVKFAWTQDTTTKYWIGYVSSVSKVNAPQRTNVMTVMCVGSTFVLKERVTRVFSNSTVPDAVAKIATEFGFTVKVDQHPQVFEQLAITGNSYWEWICEQARRIGYGIVVDGMNMFFRPIDKLINMGFSNAPVLSLGNAGAPFNTNFMDRTLDEFKVIQGDNVETENNYRTVKNVGGIDPLTGQVLLSSSSPDKVGDALRSSISPVLFSEYRTDRVINDAIAALEAAKAAAQLSRFTIPASIKAQGDPRIRPFGPTYIAGTGNLTDGFWIVKEATHMFHKIGDYILHMTVATDGIGDAVVETPFRTMTNSGAGQVNLEEAVATGDASTLSFSIDSVRLTTEKESYVTELNQGYTLTPNRWRSTANG